MSCHSPSLPNSCVSWYPIPGRSSEALQTKKRVVSHCPSKEAVHPPPERMKSINKQDTTTTPLPSLRWRSKEMKGKKHSKMCKGGAGTRICQAKKDTTVHSSTVNGRVSSMHAGEERGGCAKRFAVLPNPHRLVSSRHHTTIYIPADDPERNSPSLTSDPRPRGIFGKGEALRHEGEKGPSAAAAAE